MSHIANRRISKHHQSFANRRINNNNNRTRVPALPTSNNNIILSHPSSPSIDSTIADSEDLNSSTSSQHLNTIKKLPHRHTIPKMPNTNRHQHHSHHSRHHQNISSSSSSSHHNNHNLAYPNTAIHDPLPAACTSLLSLRNAHHGNINSGNSNGLGHGNINTRPHNAARDGALPILTMALTLMEARSAAAAAATPMHSPPTVLPAPISRHTKHAPSSLAAASGSRFWDTVLPPIPARAPAPHRRPPMVSAEDESAKMNIPCVVCGVRFRKPGHLNMHWRSVHATSSDAIYPGKLTSHATPTAPTPSHLPTTRITKHGSSSASKPSKGAKDSSSGIRPYGCPQCVSRFRRGSDRNRHMRMVHAKIRPFECTQCGSHFGRKSFLEAHISTVHEKQRPFRCHCGAAFGQRSSLTRHARKIHGPS